MKLLSVEEHIKQRIQIANIKTKSDDPVVHIAWLAKGIDIWHKSKGKRGNSPEKAMEYIISSTTRLINHQTKLARIEECKWAKKHIKIADYYYQVDVDAPLDDRIKQLQGEIECLNN